ncbi:MAG TPA: hypothetical protein VK530_19625, partial [Candidatus Acidoferrum sp.]|nr:hypothetical protein [Candidatus Acidoferrum sp.]
WNLENGEAMTTVPLPATPDRLRFSSDAKKLVASYPSESLWTVSVHDMENGATLAMCQFSSRITYIDTDPLGQWIAVCDANGSVHLLEMETGRASAIGKHPNAAAWLTFSPDGHYLISGGWERQFICWDMRTRRQIFTLPLDSFYFQFSKDGRQCATFSDGRVQCHAFDAPAALRDFGAALGSQIRHASFSTDGKWFAASGDKRMGIWNLTNDAPVALINEAADARPYFTRDSRELFGSSRVDACVRLNLGEKVERVPLTKPRGFTSLCLASNAVVWTTAQGSSVVAPLSDLESERWAETQRGVSSASANGRWLGVYRPFTSELHVYRLPRLEPVAKLTAQGDIVTFSFSPSGDEVAISSRRCVEFWNITNARRTRTLTNFTGVVFAPHARHGWLKRDRMAGLYDLDTLEPQLLLPNGMQPLALSGDGRYLAVTLESRRVQVWDLTELHQRLRELGMDWSEADTARLR